MYYYIYLIFRKDFAGNIFFMASYLSKNKTEEDMKELIEDRPTMDFDKYKFAVLETEINRTMDFDIFANLDWK